jgi:YVTN family beta-propeller protein
MHSDSRRENFDISHAERDNRACGFLIKASSLLFILVYVVFLSYFFGSLFRVCSKLFGHNGAILTIMLLSISLVAPSFMGNNTFLNIAQAQSNEIPGIDVGNMPLGITYNSCNGMIYVANALSGTVSVIDSTNNKVIDTILVGRLPVWLEYVPSTNEVYVSNFGSNDVYVINAFTDKVVKIIKSDMQGPFGLVYPPGQDSIYLTSAESGVISVPVTNTTIAGPTNKSGVAGSTSSTVTGTGDGGGQNATAANAPTTPTTNRTTNDAAGEDSVCIPTGTGGGQNTTSSATTQNTGGTASNGQNATSGKEPENNMETGGQGIEKIPKHKINPDALDPSFITYSNKNNIFNALYTSGFARGVISVINPTAIQYGNGKEAEVSDIEVGGSPAGIFHNPKNEMIYAGNFVSNKVSVIDPVKNKLVTNITVGSSPIDFAYNEVNDDIYVTNFGSDSVSVIRSDEYSVRGYIPAAGKNPFGIIYVGSPDNQKAAQIYVTNPNADKVTVVSASDIDSPTSKPLSSDTPYRGTPIVVAIVVAIVIALIVYFSFRKGGPRAVRKWFHLH